MMDPYALLLAGMLAAFAIFFVSEADSRDWRDRPGWQIACVAGLTPVACLLTLIGALRAIWGFG